MTKLTRHRRRIREVTSQADRKIGAEVTNSARYHGANVVVAFSEPLVDGDGCQYTPTIHDLAQDLRAAMSSVRDGNLARPEEMLLAQAHALQAIFTAFALKAAGPWSMVLNPAYMAIAFKAQAQSRATLTALADMKCPRQPNFIGQQNVAMNQQVNNSIAGGAVARARETEIQQSKLSGGDHELLQDGRASAVAGGNDPALETVAAINRPENDRG